MKLSLGVDFLPGFSTGFTPKPGGLFWVLRRCLNPGVLHHLNHWWLYFNKTSRLKLKFPLTQLLVSDHSNSCLTQLLAITGLQIKREKLISLLFMIIKPKFHTNDTTTITIWNRHNYINVQSLSKKSCSWGLAMHHVLSPPQRAGHASLPRPTAPLVTELLQLRFPGYGTASCHISEMLNYHTVGSGSH